MAMIYWASLVQDETCHYLFANDEGLVMITLPQETFQNAVSWINRQFANCQLIGSLNELKGYRRALNDYWYGDFDAASSIKYSLQGTVFQRTVWEELLKIPYGMTVSYQDIADRIGRPKAVRAVANAIAANPIPYLIPCHRVIGKNGELTGYRGGLELKKTLLQQERENKKL
nr:methylated-DNA--[protein]-cysteine S-methyltransferase [Bacilli bacterium]